MAESKLVAGRWVLPTVESNVDGVARMHVSVSVPEVNAMAETPMEVSMSAGGQALTVLEGPSPFYYLETLAVTAVTDVAFENPTGMDPDTVTVSIGGETVDFAVTVRPPDDAGPDTPIV